MTSNSKSISAIIASILMLLIVITLAGTSYLYISGALTGKTSTAFEIMDSYEDIITIRNSGTNPITSFRSVKIDNNDAIYLVSKSDSSLVGYWKFDESYGISANDSSGNKNDGTLSGSGNLVINPSFETDLSGWGSYVSATLTRITSEYYVGSASMQVTTAGTGPNEGTIYNPAIISGQSYVFSAYVKRTETSVDLQIAICDYTPSAGWQCGGSTIPKTTGWQQVSVTKTIQSGATALQLIINAAGSPPAVTFYVDNVQATTGSIWIDGRYGNALSFDGSNDYVGVSPTTIFSNMNSITLEAWIKFATSPSGTTQEVAQKWPGWTFGYAGGGWWFELYTTTSEYIGAYNDAWSPTPGTWYHVVSTYDGTTMKTYINGNPLANHPEALDNRIIGNNPATTFLGIGAAGYDGGISGRYFNGAIDEVRIYNRALSEQEIKANYNIGSQINAGEAATIKIYNPLSKGTHTVRMCTSSMCNVGYLTIT